jgi:hypothetical protein
MVKKTNWKLADLLQNLSNAMSDRAGRESINLDNDEYLNGVKKAVPLMEKALDDLKEYLKDK